MEYISFIYFTIGIIVALFIFITVYDRNDMPDRKPLHKFLVYLMGVTTIFLTWPVWVIMIIRIFYKINKEDYNG